MVRIGALLGLFFLMTVTAPGAESIPVGSDLRVEVSLPSARWQIFHSAPEFLVAEIAEHLEHELAAEGKHPSGTQIRQAAEKRLAANEAFVCNPASGACLIIDFSPLRADEKPPGRRNVELSARYAAEGLADEEGLSELQQKTARAEIAGASQAYRIDARYRQHGEPRQFIGYVGFAEPSWFYLYYTDPLRESADLPEMEQLLEDLAIRR